MCFLVAAHALSSRVAFPLGVWTICDCLISAVSMVAMVASSFCVVRPVSMSAEGDYLCFKLSFPDLLGNKRFLFTQNQFFLYFIFKFSAYLINLFWVHCIFWEVKELKRKVHGILLHRRKICFPVSNKVVKLSYLKYKIKY